MEMNPDYTEAKTFENLPEGDYRFQVDKGVAGESKNTGTKLVAWDLRVIEHEKLNGASLTHRTFLTGAASGFMKFSRVKTITSTGFIARYSNTCTGVATTDRKIRIRARIASG